MSFSLTSWNRSSSRQRWRCAARNVCERCVLTHSGHGHQNARSSGNTTWPQLSQICLPFSRIRMGRNWSSKTQCGQRETRFVTELRCQLEKRCCLRLCQSSGLRPLSQWGLPPAWSRIRLRLGRPQIAEYSSGIFPSFLLQLSGCNVYIFLTRPKWPNRGNPKVTALVLLP